ncbi:MAG: hypothetical protein MUF78_03925, partial [Candidatus Edwardsbacteria bacterium]|nr:hypothetical protein [Candidatus Edwardsbacteria bacterium]
YGEDFVPRESAVKYGVAEYAASLDAAKRMTDRVGTNPLVVTAIRASGLNKSDLVIADKDIETVATIADNTEVYESCKVVIVLRQQ